VVRPFPTIRRIRTAAPRVVGQQPETILVAHVEILRNHRHRARAAARARGVGLDNMGRPIPKGDSLVPGRQSQLRRESSPLHG